MKKEHKARLSEGPYFDLILWDVANMSNEKKTIDGHLATWLSAPVRKPLVIALKH